MADHVTVRLNVDSESLDDTHRAEIELQPNTSTEVNIVLDGRLNIQIMINPAGEYTIFDSLRGL